MELADLVRLFAGPLDFAVVLTDVDLERPGPTVLYANPAFARMSGYAPAEVVGGTPRILQGRTRTARPRGTCRGSCGPRGASWVACGTTGRAERNTLCEIDVRPILGRDGVPQAFIAFEREVVRRRGRPAEGGTRRYRPTVQVPPPLVGTGAPLFA